jgi:hypothetical protein
MINKLPEFFKGKKNNSISKGLGVTELPLSIYQGKQPIKSSDFKNIISDIFLPKIQELGFKGKDFVYYRENKTYTEVVFFWTYKTGGAIQIDLLIKFNDIHYPDEEKLLKTKDIRPINADFQKRLSPNEEKNKHGQDVWFWIFQNSIDKNIEVVEDIWRVFSIRGIEYFGQFVNHIDYIKEITTMNYVDFPDFQLQRFFGRFERGILFFLFDYWRKMDNGQKAIEFAKIGYDKLKNEKENIYFKEFNGYLKI